MTVKRALEGVSGRSAGARSAKDDVKGHACAEPDGSGSHGPPDVDVGDLTAAESDPDSVCSYLEDGFDAFEDGSGTVHDSPGHVSPLLSVATPTASRSFVTKLPTPTVDVNDLEASTVSSEASGTPVAASDAPVGMPPRSVSPLAVQRIGKRPVVPPCQQDESAVSGATSASALVLDLMRSAQLSPRCVTAVRVCSVPTCPSERTVWAPGRDRCVLPSAHPTHVWCLLLRRWLWQRNHCAAAKLASNG